MRATSTLLELIEEARNAELCRDIEESRRCLGAVWPDQDVDPSFDDLPDEINAALLRLSGFFLSFAGKSLNRLDYLDRAKDLLSRSIRIFEELRLDDRAAEANVMLALAYFNAGEIEECKAIHDAVEDKFSSNPLHPVYLQIRVNRVLTLIYQRGPEDIKAAVEIIESMGPGMDYISDPRLRAKFHNQAGIVYRLDGDLDRSIFHMNEAIRNARTGNVKLFEGMNLNNLALTLCDRGDFDSALSTIDAARAIFEGIRNHGYVPHILDTKSSIYLKSGNAKAALAEVNAAISLFQLDTDTAGLADAMWTKCLCLFRLERTEDAIKLFAELYNLAAVKIGAVATDKYTAALAAEIYIRTGSGFHDEVTSFKKSLVRSAMKEAGNVVGRAAQILGLSNHQALSEILRKQMPDLVDELELPRRRSRSDSKASKRVRLINSTPQISLLPLDDKSEWIVDGYEDWKNVYAFFVSKTIMKEYGIAKDCIVAAARPTLPDEPKDGHLVIYKLEEEFHIGCVRKDEFSRLRCIQTSNQFEPRLLDELEIIGMLVGYSDWKNIDRLYIEFENFDAETFNG